MARRFVRASSEYIFTKQTLSAGNSYPFTMAAWAKTTNLTDEQIILQYGKDGQATRCRLMIRGNVANDPLSFNTNASSSNNYPSTSTVPNGEWFHAVGVTRADRTKSVYFNGANRVNSSSTLSWTTGIDAIVVGAGKDSTYSSHLDGDVADAAIWNVELTDSEIAALAKGVSPLQIRPASLVYYAPLIRDMRPYKGEPVTASSGTTVADHPRIYMPRPALVWPGATAGGDAEVTPNDATHGHSADQVALSQVHGLIIGSAGHGHAADDVTLVQVHDLGVEDAVHSHQVDAVALAQVHALGVSAARHDHLADVVTLGQIHGLAIDDAAHEHTAEGVTIAQIHALLVGDTFHSHFASQMIFQTILATPSIRRGAARGENRRGAARGENRRGGPTVI